MKIDLRKCVGGDRLLSCHNEILIYRGLSGIPEHPHRIEYADGGYGTRTNDGFVMWNPIKRLDTDHNVVCILGKDSNRLRKFVIRNNGILTEVRTRGRTGSRSLTEAIATAKS